MNRDGSTMTPIASISQGSHEDPRLSPDGSRALVTRDGDIWIYELDSGRSSRVTRDGSSLMGVWSPTGSQVAYSSARGGNLEAWVGPSDGSGQPRQLTKLGGQVHVDSWSPDGRILSVHHHPGAGPTKIYMLALDRADPKPEAFLDGDFGAESATVLTRWKVCGVSFNREWPARDLHSSLSRAWRAGDGLSRRWSRTDLGQKR